MDNNTLKRLEFDKIKQRLATHAASEIGKELSFNIEPSTDLVEVLRWQKETTEARQLLRFEPAADFNQWHDLRSYLVRLQRNGVMAAEELFFVGETLATSRRIKGFLVVRAAKYPLLAELAEDLAEVPVIEKAILSAILPGGEIDDHASSELAQIRRHLITAKGRVKDRLDHIIRSSDYQKYLQEAIVTIRGDRYVVPVKQEYRSQIPGLVHDQSSSGATLFIEPLSVVEANNEVRKLVAAEKQEILRILTNLSALAAGVVAELEETTMALGYLDFVLAKAYYSKKIDAWQPTVTEGAKIHIKRGRHPLLEGKVVPVDVRLGEAFHIMVITGPNTGGKTVTLKTVGLVILMAQAGLHIPVDEGSQIGIFTQVFADIGDEQSIEQSLSTFSSHMRNIVGIVNQADEKSLVLLDELGSGTDPTEGAALAQAVLEHLHTHGARTIATTHYSELKNFAYSHQGVENASVEFNNETLQPTYKLILGKPGRSNAFEIAARLGLSKELVENARSFLSTEQIEHSVLMEKMELTQQQAEKERKQAEAYRRDSEILKERYRKLDEKLQLKKEEILSKAQEEARLTIKKAKEMSEEIVKELRVKLSQESAREREEGIKKAREQLYDLQDKTTKKRIKTVVSDRQAPKKLSLGAEVFLPQYNQKGYVLEIKDKDMVLVQVGILKITVPKNELQMVQESESKSGYIQVGKGIKEKAQTVASSLDMRGKMVEEGLLEMEKYLDDAYLVRLKQVSLIHGKGTGALRAAVQRELKHHRRVKQFRLGEIGEGGAGITIVELNLD